MKSFFIQNAMWIVPILVAIIGAVAKCLAAKLKSKDKHIDYTNMKQVTNTTQNVVVNVNSAQGVLEVPEKQKQQQQVSRKGVGVLFIDDEKFSVIQILRKAGWVNVRTVRDVDTLEDPNIVASSVIFVDIVGVGIKLAFKNQGIGLAAAIKQKYKDKKVWVYSAESKHNIFDADLKVLDGLLSKNAEPIEFMSILEDVSYV